jgi:hypothetical protein
MTQRKLMYSAIFLSLILAGCSGGSDDNGGTVGGSGLLPYCQRDAGVYNYPDGSRVEIMPNCDFKMTMADGNRARGTVNSISEDGVISMDMIIDSGPAAGTCATVTGSPTSFDMTNVHQCG